MLCLADVFARAKTIFPAGVPNHGVLVRELTAKLIFTCLYANAIDGSGRWLRPNQVCKMNDAQALLTCLGERERWFT